MAHFIFMSAFYAVLTVVAGTVLFALWRSRNARRNADEIRWRSDFHDLASDGRACRHALTGEFRRRECPNAFDCRVCQTHARMPQRPRTGDLDEEIGGMFFPLDRFYHRGHTWARLGPDGVVTVGLDELGKRLLGRPDAVDLPAVGTRVHANGTAFRVKKREADVRVLSPVDGSVIETGGRERGWYLRVRPDNLDLTHLLRGAEVKPWVMRELERLQLALSLEGAPSLADGGVPVEDIAAGYPEADWDAVCGEIFLEP